MRHKLLNDGPQRTFAVVLDSGDEAMESLKSFAAEQRLSAAQVTGIGAFSGLMLKYFDWESKSYLENRVDEQVEVASLVGDVAVSPSGEPSVHIHLVVGRRDGTALAGHLGSGWVRPTLEVIVTESPTHLQKERDPVTGLALIKLER
ncbi:MULTISPECIES: PPC domain-containing DNA-binding protein [unclassified Bradyrhizobium]|uniref:PPC domain-containing DNA-binding protein n=1 Tax=unclassified Bradyrhizobium TaxID=2631580 RepID=UPI001FF9B5DB|nr:MULTISPECIES: PPC domain-containing DNA-binding protein [unclassified Bradyrhizobium]MCK1304376.1 DNA-binding protein [Bradyrhizobium sp. 45]MCK1317316.1 DNA-binding protein [Bradyrhizobium sp. 23]MCK1435430.1 DNA-binding protein [Bradyrhizobium sp. 15]MCK1451960.1 DNA-binding protein [Bradyrhizobium sp. 35]MCK1614868.1 DNA-binding protein [Bradyrhizobium sp. 163]